MKFSDQTVYPFPEFQIKCIWQRRIDTEGMASTSYQDVLKAVVLFFSILFLLSCHIPLSLSSFSLFFLITQILHQDHFRSKLNQLLQKMVDLTFQGLFLTTNKGIPDLNYLPASTTLAKPFYIYSLLLQGLFFLFFLLYFALSIFRITKKIKNSRFEDVPDVDAVEEENAKRNQQKKQGEENENEKEDKLIYRFDDEDEEQYEDEKKEKDIDQHGSQVEKSEHIKQKQKEETVKEESYDDYHDASEDAFIELDDKLLFMQPLLVSFIVCNSLFAADPSTLILFVLTIASFFAFNIKGKMANVKATQVLFLVFSILGFFAFFYNDHDLTT